MGEKFDDMKGRAKEAAGDVTNNDDLKREGKIDQAKSSVKETANKVTDRVGDAIHDVTD